MTEAKQEDTLNFCTESCLSAFLRAHNGEYPRCGCGKPHKIKPFLSHLMHWKGQHWVQDCLTEKLLKNFRQDRQAIALLISRMKKLQNDLAQLQCADCSQPVGRNYRRFGTAVYCPQCSHELGGES